MRKVRPDETGRGCVNVDTLSDSLSEDARPILLKVTAL